MNKRMLVVPMLLMGAAVGWSQKPAEDKTFSQDAMSGVQMYKLYCATCHGTDGKGNGPAASAMKAKVPDLTLLTKNAGGKFPLMKVQQTISGDILIPSHGSRDMPIYGDMFRDVKRDESFVKQRVGLLTGFVESLQKK